MRRPWAYMGARVEVLGRPCRPTGGACGHRRDTVRERPAEAGVLTGKLRKWGRSRTPTVAIVRMVGVRQSERA